jgi:hypothetical protein
VNLQGVNLQGVNLSGTTLNGSTETGTNLAGNSVVGTTLNATALAGSSTGRNIHNLGGSINGMLYSAEDLWAPKTGQCIVVGIGSTAFAKLLRQQTLNAKISVALGRLPWSFSDIGGAPWRAWEAVVWGDKTYCVFVMAAPSEATWPGVAGFIKSVFRWNAPPTQKMEISGIEASAPHDPSLRTAIDSYDGMMNAAALWGGGSLTDLAFMAGEAGLVSATTNNQAVLVDFATWVQDKNKNPLVLGNVTATSPPTFAEALYVVLDNGDGSVQVVLDDSAARARAMPGTMTNSVVDLNTAYQAYLGGMGLKPIPRRCGGAQFLKTWYNEPVPPGKCDDGLSWNPGFCDMGTAAWSTVAGTTAPMNGYMQLTKAGGGYRRGLPQTDGSCGTMKTVLSETYVHMWERNYDMTPSASCVPESNATFCGRRAFNCGPFTGTDNCGNQRTVSNCGVCVSPATCGGDGRPNVCGRPTTRIYEAEAPGNTLNGSAYVYACPQAYTKPIGANDPELVPGTCSGGARVRYLGNGSTNHVVVNNVNVATTTMYTMTVHASSSVTRTLYASVNGATGIALQIAGSTGTGTAVSTNIPLRAGNNTIKFYNSTAPAPDLDRIKISVPGPACTLETNAAFCARLARNCGPVTGTDNCGNPRTVSSCGTCVAPQTCGGGGQANVCGSR